MKKKLAVEFVIDRKDWARSMKKWSDVVAHLEAGSLPKARRAFNRGCGYCKAFNKVAFKYKLHDGYMDLLDLCHGCPLGDRHLCCNDFHEQAKAIKLVAGETEWVSTRAYWRLNDLFNKGGMFPVMLDLARKIRDAIAEDETIFVKKEVAK